MDDDSARGLGPRDLTTLPDLVAGIGARRMATADEIVALVAATLDEIGADAGRLGLLVTRQALADHPALRAAADRLDVPLLGLSDVDLGAGAPHPSSRVAALVGVPSVAEAAALAFGRLLASKRRSANATCAIARRYADADRMSLSAPSTVSASTAGA